MNSNQIEKLAINCLEKQLLKCPYIDYDIDTNDKTPSWDGTIYLYSDSAKKKADLICKCEIQIKGKESLRGKRSYSVSVDDLNNYKNHGGVIFFVVDIKTDTIFYSELLPVKIGSLFKRISENNKKMTLSIRLEKFPSSPKAIENLIKNFCEHSDKQRGSKGNIVGFKNLATVIDRDCKIMGRFNLLKEDDKVYLPNKDTYLYKVNSDGTVLPIDIFTIEEVLKSEEVDIFVDEKFLFKGILKNAIRRQGEIPYSVLNGNIYIYHGNNENGHFEFKFEGSLQELKSSLSLMQAMLNGKQIKFNNGIEFSCQKNKRKLKIIDADYKMIERAYFVVDKLNLDVFRDFSEFTETDLNKLLSLSKYLVYEDELVKPKLIGFNLDIYEFSFSKVLLLFGKTTEEDIVVINPFNSNIMFEMINDINRVKYPLLFTLNRNDLTTIANIDFTNIFHIIDTFDVNDKSIGVLIHFILEALFAFDEKRNGDLLDCIEALAFRIYKFEPSIENYINYLQCAIRSRAISKNEIDTLYGLRESYEGDRSDMINCAIALIVKNHYEYRYSYSHLNQESKEQFDNWPIKKLEELLT